MNFYELWENALHDDKLSKEYFVSFLYNTEESLKVFKDGTDEELVQACKLLMSIPIAKFIEYIETYRNYSAEDIFQYSSFDSAINKVCSILAFSDTPLTYAELGKKLTNSKSDDACKKYGENHSKLARSFLMVEFERKSSFEVKNTAFGNFSIYLSNDDKIEIIKRLALRNVFVQDLIHYAKLKKASYATLASKVLSATTVSRRKSNIKYIMGLILKDNDLFNSIVW